MLDCSRGEGAATRAVTPHSSHVPSSLELGTFEALADLKAIGDDLAAAAAASTLMPDAAPGDIAESAPDSRADKNGPV